jgi:hypothetical protein
MSTSKKSQRTFMSVTMITVIAISTVFIVYAALLATYTGNNVTISSMGGSIEYSLTKDPGSWGTGAISQGEGAEWYARINLGTPPSQDVTVTWTLQMQNGADWTTIPPTDTNEFTSPQISLTPSTYIVYAFDTGSNDISNNYNWGQDTTAAGIYRIVVEINTV